MIYSFTCPTCKKQLEVVQGMNDDHTPPVCQCGARTTRIWDSRVNGDELRSTKYIDPVTKKERKDHGRVFDVGMGAWYSTWSERARLMKEKNLGEFGPETKHPPSNLG